jgi:ATP-binding cassette subfamily F protein uup
MISYLQIENLTKTYGERVLFQNISFSVGKEQKVALIAKNGSGKTSLMNILASRDVADSGSVVFRKDIEIGYLKQEPDLNDNLTVIEQVFSSSHAVVKAVKEYEAAILTHDEKLLQKTAEQMDRLGAWDYELKIKQILDKLKITDFNRLVKELSGGQKKRLALANALINEPDFLMMDEPTNHLDYEMIEWLEEYFSKSKVTLLLVTHDRYFLDRVCDVIIEMADNQIYTYHGNYAHYLSKRSERIELFNAEIERAKNLYRREADWMNRMPQARATKAKSRIDNFYKVKEKAGRKLENQEMELEIQTRRLGNKILELENISKSYGNQMLIRDFSYKFSRNEKIGIFGKNAVGKTTFLNVITETIQADCGIIEKGETVVYGYYTQSGISLEEDKRVIEVIKDVAEVIETGSGRTLSASQFLDYFLFPPETHYNMVSKLSGGEKRRLYLMTVLMKNPNFLILDEPTNDLDIITLNVLEDYLINFKGCLLIVSHDRYFTDRVVDNLLIFEGDGIIRNFPGNYSAFNEELQNRKKEEKRSEEKSDKTVSEKSKIKDSGKMSYKEKKEFEELEIQIQNLTDEKKGIENLLISGTCPINEYGEKSRRLNELIEIIDEKEFRWLELSEKNI